MPFTVSIFLASFTFSITFFDEKKKKSQKKIKFGEIWYKKFWIQIKFLREENDLNGSIKWNEEKIISIQFKKKKLFYLPIWIAALCHNIIDFYNSQRRIDTFGFDFHSQFFDVVAHVFHQIRSCFAVFFTWCFCGFFSARSIERRKLRKMEKNWERKITIIHSKSLALVVFHLVLQDSKWFLRYPILLHVFLIWLHLGAVHGLF